MVHIGVPLKSRQNAIFGSIQACLKKGGRTWVVPNQKTPKIWDSVRTQALGIGLE